jgi:hypothetical protein
MTLCARASMNWVLPVPGGPAMARFSARPTPLQRGRPVWVGAGSCCVRAGLERLPGRQTGGLAPHPSGGVVTAADLLGDEPCRTSAGSQRCARARVASTSGLRRGGRAAASVSAPRAGRRTGPLPRCCGGWRQWTADRSRRHLRMSRRKVTLTQPVMSWSRTTSRRSGCAVVSSICGPEPAAPRRGSGSGGRTAEGPPGHAQSRVGALELGPSVGEQPRRGAAVEACASSALIFERDVEVVVAGGPDQRGELDRRGDLGPDLS